MTIFFKKINERWRSSFKTSPLPLIFLSARAWPPGFVQGGSGHPCFHTKGHGSTLPRRRRHQAAVPAPPANSKHRTSSPVHRLCIEHLDRKQHLAAILLVSLYAVGQDQQWRGRLASRSAHQSPGQESATHVFTHRPALQRSQTNFPERAYGLRKETSTSSAAQISSNPG